MRALLRFVAPRDRELAESKAEALLRMNGAWASQLLGPAAGRACENLAFVVASTSPTMAPDRLSLWLRLCLWTIFADDKLDDPAATMSAVEEIGSRVSTALNDVHHIAQDDVVCGSLHEVLQGLAEYDRSGFWLPHVVVGLQAGVLAGVEHVRLSRLVRQGALRAPTYEAYLDLASKSINHRAVALAMLLLTDDEPATEDDLRRLNCALDSACCAIRLANDLRSIERHQSEGLLNALLLCTADGQAVTPELLRRQIRFHGSVYNDLVASISTSSDVREALSSSLRLAVGVYGLGDLR